MARPKNTVKTVCITISTTEPVVSGLQEMTDTGLYGKNPTETAERLLCKCIQDFRKEDSAASKTKNSHRKGFLWGTG
jgi:hypothetical protein